MRALFNLFNSKTSGDNISPYKVRLPIFRLLFEYYKKQKFSDTAFTHLLGMNAIQIQEETKSWDLETIGVIVQAL